MSLLRTLVPGRAFHWHREFITIRTLRISPPGCRNGIHVNESFCFDIGTWVVTENQKEIIQYDVLDLYPNLVERITKWSPDMSTN